MVVARVRSVELFTGAGGLALGTHLAGFHHDAVLEYEHNSCCTLRLNTLRGLDGVDWRVVEEDVRRVEFSNWAVGDEMDLLAGGPPCQPFSLGGKHRGHADPRNMFPEAIRAVRELRPRAVLFENVKGIMRPDFRPYFDYIIASLQYPFVLRIAGETWQDHMARLVSTGMGSDTVPERDRYDVQWQIVNVANYGVPQVRHRVFVVGFRHDLSVRWTFPAPTHSRAALLYAQDVNGSYWEDHNLPRQDGHRRVASDRWTGSRDASAKPTEKRWQTVRDALRGLPDPRERDDSPGFDSHVGIPDARSYPGHTGSPWDWPAKAIKAGDHGNPGGENMLRRDDGSVRYFTVRELARLQTFPDDWQFANSWTESRRQLGNAVPVLMARTIGERIAAALQGSSGSQDETGERQAIATGQDPLPLFG